MNFSDKIERNGLDIVFVFRTEKEMMAREESESNLWDIERPSRLKGGKKLYSIPARDIKVCENIHDKSGKYIAYRIN